MELLHPGCVGPASMPPSLLACEDHRVLRKVSATFKTAISIDNKIVVAEVAFLSLQIATLSTKMTVKNCCKNGKRNHGIRRTDDEKILVAKMVEETKLVMEEM